MRNRQVRPLNEELKEIGLDPEKTLSAMHRTNKLIEDRIGGNSGGGMPSYLRPVDRGEPAIEHQPGDESGVELAEALRVMRRRRTTSAEKSAGRRVRRKRRGAIKSYAKKYYKRMKRKISKLMKRKRKKFGGTAGLEKLHTAGRRITMSANSPLAGLREDLNQPGSAGQHESNSFEDAALQAGLLAMYLGEMFEAFGDKESAETMYDCSDAAADLAEALETLGAEGEMNEAQEDQLQRVLDSLIKGLRMYEAMGSPSLPEIEEFAEANGNGDDDDDDDDDDEDEDDDDDDED